MNLSEDNVFVGLMLSDAHIRRIRNMTGKTSFEIKQKTDRREFLEKIQIHFEKINLFSTIRDYIVREKYQQSILYTMATLELGDERMHWYPKGIKRVPRDIKLNPEVIAYWIYGDGGSERCGVNNNSVKVTLYTNSFPMNDIEFLRNQLKDLGIESTTHMRRGDEPVILVSKALSVQKLMDMIKPYMLECFQYKIKEPHLIDFGDQVEKQRIRSLENYHSLSPEEKKQRNHSQWKNVKDIRNPERKDRYHSDLEYQNKCKARSNRNYKPHPRVKEPTEHCTYCKSTNTKKHGKNIYDKFWVKRFMCNSCGKTFSGSEKTEIKKPNPISNSIIPSTETFI